MNTTRNTERVRRTARWFQTACGLFCVLAVGLAGCGGGGSGTTPAAPGSGGSPTGGGGGPTGSGPDRTADFVINTDPASESTLLKPGQTLPVTLDLFSVNGFPSAITLSASDVTPGWTVVPVTPTVSSLPKGVTKVVFNVTAPADAPPPGGAIAQIKAVGGGLTRYLNGGGVYSPKDDGKLQVNVAGLTLHTYAPGTSPFASPFAFVANDLNGNVDLVGGGLTGPVTVAVTSANPGLTATLVKSVFTPYSGAIQDSVQIKLHVDSSVGGGAYPLTLTATAPDGTKATSILLLYVKSVAFVGSPELSIGKAAGSTASVAADLTITGAPGGVVQLTIPNAPTKIDLTVSPASVTIPASGTITQRLTLQGRMTTTSTPTAFGVDLMATFGDGSSQSPTFFVRVN